MLMISKANNLIQCYIGCDRDHVNLNRQRERRQKTRLTRRAIKQSDLLLRKCIILPGVLTLMKSSASLYGIPYGEAVGKPNKTKHIFTSTVLINNIDQLSGTFYREALYEQFAT